MKIPFLAILLYSMLNLFVFAEDEIVSIDPFTLDFRTVHLNNDQKEKITQLREGKASITDFVFNDYINFEGEYIGYVAYFPKEIEGSLDKKYTPVLIKYLEEKDRFVASHIYLSFLYKDSCSGFPEINELPIAKLENASPEEIEELIKKIHDFWKTKLITQQGGAADPIVHGNFENEPHK